MCSEDISKGLKMGATILQYPTTCGIPIKQIDTHSLHSGGMNTPALSGYSNTQIQKMGRWKGVMFEEYIHEELACYSAWMVTSMKCNFKFVNVSGGAYHNITAQCIKEDYNINCALAV